jgi:hypothetical protein
MPAKGQDMPTSIFLAKLIGPVYVAIGIAVIANRATFHKLVEEFLASPALIFFAGVVTLPVGLAIVLTHNVWTADWRVIITILGWLAAISGAIRLIVPHQAITLSRRMLSKPAAFQFSAAFYLVVGAVLCFFGYFR